MQKSANRGKTTPRWMNECDVIRYTLKMPEGMKKKIKDEALQMDMDMSSYICGVLGGEIKRKKG